MKIELFSKETDRRVLSVLSVFKLSYTTKNMQVARSLLTSRNSFVTTSRHQDAFAKLSTTCGQQLMQVCCKLSTDPQA